MQSAALAVLLVVATILPPLGLVATPARALQSNDPRYFGETGLRIDDDRFWDYFSLRGGERTFGPPVSMPFQLLGTRVQLFRQRVLQLHPDGSVGVLNLAGDDFFPYTLVGGSTLPEIDEAYVWEAPDPSDLDAALAFVRERVPDEWDGAVVNFLATFENSVSYEEAFPSDDGEPALLPGFGYELWGLPLGAPGRDSRLPNVIYQRFQKGIMRHDTRTGRTEGAPLAEYFKAILTGEALPPDLEAAAQTSRFYRQFDATAPLRVARPDELPGTNLHGILPGSTAAQSERVAGAFVSLAVPSTTAGPRPDVAASQPAATPAPAVNTDISRCQGDELMTFSPRQPVVGSELLIAVTSSKAHQFVRLTGETNPAFLRERRGQRGQVWEWTVTPTSRGRHEFVFYIDSTAVCLVGAVEVGIAGGTPTPVPTLPATLQPTPLPTFEAIASSLPTSTPIPTATPQVASASTSFADVAPAVQAANRMTAASPSTVTITVTLLDSARQTLPGKVVRIASQNRASADAIAVSDPITDSQGRMVAIVSSCLLAGETAPVSSTFTITDLSDNVAITAPAVTWITGSTPCAPPSATATATATPATPTATATAVPPTATATPVTPTATATAVTPTATATPVPPTATATPVTPTATATSGSNSGPGPSGPNP